MPLDINPLAGDEVDRKQGRLREALSWRRSTMTASEQREWSSTLECKDDLVHAEETQSKKEGCAHLAS